VNPPLEIAGTGQKCTIKALNERGNILLPAVIDTMNTLLEDSILEDVQISEGQVDVTVVPPGEVGSFSEEERSKQVCLQFFFLGFF
jgi:anthranilate synthase